MKTIFFACSFLLSTTILFSQTQTAPTIQVPQFFDVKKLKATPVKNQAMTGTCWCFATTSLVESEGIRKDKQEIELSEMFTVRNIYIEKAKNYILRGGKAQFGEGGLGHDEIRAAAIYGAVPLSEYSGLLNGQKSYNHQKLFTQLQQYLDSTLKKQPIANGWLNGYIKILDENLGTSPSEFTYNGKKYSPQSFAKEVLHFNAGDYVSISSFTHQPYYQPFILQVPDNFTNGSFYNLPLNEMVQLVKDALNNGYSVGWDADVSNKGFLSSLGLALNLDNNASYPKDQINPDVKEMPYDAATRQQLYENLTTQDDHLMHITGIEKSKDGKTFFIVKNSWGKIGPFEGYIHVSEAYFAINTISLVVPKAALSKELVAKLGIK
ncbi:MAG TPA: C1 family peptidase [Chitinophagaceae bacterium]|jgi:bleomycin hydrolase|nr:C1 family peptidase [Chitinophagaceae bacterium]